MGNGDQAYSLLPPDEWGVVNDSLLRLPSPYAGWLDFSTSYLGFRQPKTINHNVSFEVEAPYGTMFYEFGFKDEVYRTSLIRPPTVSLSELEVTAVLVTSDEPRRLHLQPDGAKLLGSDPFLLSDVVVPVDEARSLELHLLLRGHDVDALRQPFATRETNNPRLAALSGIELIEERLDEMLGEPQRVRSAPKFEMLVAWVLHLCGFQVMLTDFGPLKGEDAPDLLAFEPLSDRGVVVEVTGKDVLNREKLTKLARRRSDIQKHLPELPMFAVAVAAAADSLQPAEVSEAASAGVILLSRIDLQELLKRAQDNELSSKILGEAIFPLKDRPIPSSA